MGGADMEAVPLYPHVCTKGASEGACAQTLSTPWVHMQGKQANREAAPPPPPLCMCHGGKQTGGCAKPRGWPHPPLCTQGQHAYQVHMPPLCTKQRGTDSSHTMGAHEWEGHGNGWGAGATWNGACGPISAHLCSPPTT